jgi:hypothetical protein
MNGDRVPDLVRVIAEDSRILVAPGAGLGFFEDPGDMGGVPPMMQTDRWEISRHQRRRRGRSAPHRPPQLGLWINQHDGNFAEAGGVDWPALEADEVVLVTDIDGSGTLDILRVDTDGSQPWRASGPIFPSAPACSQALREWPRLLARAHLPLGRAARRGRRRRGRAWSSTPPERDARAHRDPRGRRRRLVEHAAPHPRDGWYDPARGEFRGFAELRDETRRRRLHRGRRPSRAATTSASTDEARALQLLAAETRSPRGALVREVHTLAVDTPPPASARSGGPPATPFTSKAAPSPPRPRAHRMGSRRRWATCSRNAPSAASIARSGADLPGDERITTTLYASRSSPTARATASPSRS